MLSLFLISFSCLMSIPACSLSYRVQVTSEIIQHKQYFKTGKHYK